MKVTKKIFGRDFEDEMEEVILQDCSCDEDWFEVENTFDRILTEYKLKTFYLDLQKSRICFS